MMDKKQKSDEKRFFSLKLPPFTLEGFDLTTYSSGDEPTMHLDHM
jgi:hypothetical protein